MAFVKASIVWLLTRVRARWVGVVLVIYWVQLFVLMHIPLPRGLDVRPGMDKLVHFGAYTGLAFLLGLWILAYTRDKPGRRWKYQVLAIVGLLLWAIVDELLQIPVNRSADVYDCLADWLGVVAGFFGLGILQCLVAEEEPLSATS